jgi:lytic murein transglycosylase
MALTRLRSSLLALALTFVAAPAFGAACGNDGSGFDAWLADFQKDAAAQGISDNALNALNGLTYDKKVIAADRNQKQFKQSFEQFSGRMIPPRVKRAKGMLQKYADTLARIEQQYGVPGEVVIAIWGLETDFGAVKGKSSTLRSLATLAYDCRRGEFFTGQLVDALQIIDRGDLSAEQMRGGLHGELGQTQFLPSSYIAFAVDFDGNGRRDLLSSPTDVLGSTASYLKGYGWQPGQSWEEGTNNFQVIKAWNKSQVYSLTVAEFAGSSARVEGKHPSLSSLRT